MSLVLRAAETVAEEEASGLPLALTLGIGTFVVFALLVFLVSRLNQDR
jgi:hypothetical protein